MNQTEQWKDVVGWVGYYKVSDRGRYKSLPRIVIRSNGSPLTVSGRVMKTHPDRDGYQMTILQKPGFKETPYLHQIILEAFVGPCPTGGECRHLDGDKTNNHLENLCWGTKKENGEDRVNHGTSFASAMIQRKLQPSDIPLIHQLYSSGMFIKHIAKQFNVSYGTIQDILYGKSYQQYQPAIKATIRPRSWRGRTKPTSPK